MQFLSLILASAVLVTACSPASADICEKQSGITVKWVPPQQPVLEKYPQLIEMIEDADLFRRELERLGFDFRLEEDASWAFRCDGRDVLKIAYAHYAFAAPGEENQEGYMIGYGENGTIVAVANRFNYRAP